MAFLARCLGRGAPALPWTGHVEADYPAPEADVEGTITEPGAETCLVIDLVVIRGELADAVRERIVPLSRPVDGWERPWRDHRQVINGVLWWLRTGVPWRDLLERFGPWQTVYERFAPSAGSSGRRVHASANQRAMSRACVRVPAWPRRATEMSGPLPLSSLRRNTSTDPRDRRQPT